MSTPWMVAIVCLWVAVVVLVLVVAGVLRRVATVLESLPASVDSLPRLPAGPALGQPLPRLEVAWADGTRRFLSDLQGPAVLAVLTSQCATCLMIVDALREQSAGGSRFDGLVVLTDATGRERVTLGAEVEVLADVHGRLHNVLQLPGTPFVVAVDAQGLVRQAQILTGVAELSGMLQRARDDGITSRSAS